MRFSASVLLLGTLIGMSGLASARDSSASNCVSFAEAGKHLGASQCVRGTVLHVEKGVKGATFLTFCQEPKVCPFTVVVFPSDLRKVGDVRRLEGRQVEIKGTIQDYDGRAEIILRRSRQLGDAAFLVHPPVPIDYDVERAGHYSAGSIRPPKAAKKKETKQDEPMSIEDPGEPQ